MFFLHPRVSFCSSEVFICNPKIGLLCVRIGVYLQSIIPLGKYFFRLWRSTSWIRAFAFWNYNFEIGKCFFRLNFCISKVWSVVWNSIFWPGKVILDLGNMFYALEVSLYFERIFLYFKRSNRWKIIFFFEFIVFQFASAFLIFQIGFFFWNVFLFNSKVYFCVPEVYFCTVKVKVYPPKSIFVSRKYI